MTIEICVISLDSKNSEPSKILIAVENNEQADNFISDYCVSNDTRPSDFTKDFIMFMDYRNRYAKSQI